MCGIGDLVSLRLPLTPGKKYHVVEPLALHYDPAISEPPVMSAAELKNIDGYIIEYAGAEQIWATPTGANAQAFGERQLHTLHAMGCALLPLPNMDPINYQFAVSRCGEVMSCGGAVKLCLTEDIEPDFVLETCEFGSCRACYLQEYRCKCALCISY